MHLTPFTQPDIPAAVALQQNAIRTLCVSNHTPEVCQAWANSITATDFSGFTAGEYYVVKENNKLMAMGGWQGDNLKLFYIAPERVGQGYATQFFKALEDIYTQSKPKVWHVIANLTAVPFYLKMGFKKVQDYTLTLATGLEIPVMIMTKKYV